RDDVSWMRGHCDLAGERSAFHLLPADPPRVGRVVCPVRNQRDVLDEGATKGDVQHLDAAAHSQEGESPVEHALDELELEGVPVRIGDCEELVRLLAVTARLDVPAAAEQDAAAGVEGIVEI